MNLLIISALAMLTNMVCADTITFYDYYVSGDPDIRCPGTCPVNIFDGPYPGLGNKIVEANSIFGFKFNKTFQGECIYTEVQVPAQPAGSCPSWLDAQCPDTNGVVLNTITINGSKFKSSQRCNDNRPPWQMMDFYGKCSEILSMKSDISSQGFKGTTCKGSSDPRCNMIMSRTGNLVLNMAPPLAVTTAPCLYFDPYVPWLAVCADPGFVPLSGYYPSNRQIPDLPTTFVAGRSGMNTVFQFRGFNNLEYFDSGRLNSGQGEAYYSGMPDGCKNPQMAPVQMFSSANALTSVYTFMMKSGDDLDFLTSSPTNCMNVDSIINQFGGLLPQWVYTYLEVITYYKLISCDQISRNLNGISISVSIRMLCAFDDKQSAKGYINSCDNSKSVCYNTINSLNKPLAWSIGWLQGSAKLLSQMLSSNFIIKTGGLMSLNLVASPVTQDKINVTCPLITWVSELSSMCPNVTCPGCPEMVCTTGNMTQSLTCPTTSPTNTHSCPNITMQGIEVSCGACNVTECPLIVSTTGTCSTCPECLVNNVTCEPCPTQGLTDTTTTMTCPTCPVLTCPPTTTQGVSTCPPCPSVTCPTCPLMTTTTQTTISCPTITTVVATCPTTIGPTTSTCTTTTCPTAPATTTTTSTGCVLPKWVPDIVDLGNFLQRDTALMSLGLMGYKAIMTTDGGMIMIMWVRYTSSSIRCNGGTLQNPLMPVLVTNEGIFPINSLSTGLGAQFTLPSQICTTGSTVCQTNQNIIGGVSTAILTGSSYWTTGGSTVLLHSCSSTIS